MNNFKVIIEKIFNLLLKEIPNCNCPINLIHSSIRFIQKNHLKNKINNLHLEIVYININIIKKKHRQYYQKYHQVLKNNFIVIKKIHNNLVWINLNFF